MTATDGQLTWRPLAADDLPLLQRWLREPLVARWWNHDTSDEAIERDFGPSIRGEEPGEDLVVSLNGTPVGLVQRSKIAAYPAELEEFEHVMEVPDGAVELDYLIGEAELRGTGLGPRVIAALVADTWAKHADVPTILICVVAGNRASWRAAEKAGLTRIAEAEMEPDNPIDQPLHYVYRVDRPS